MNLELQPEVAHSPTTCNSRGNLGAGGHFPPGGGALPALIEQVSLHQMQRYCPSTRCRGHSPAPGSSAGRAVKERKRGHGGHVVLAQRKGSLKVGDTGGLLLSEIIQENGPAVGPS